MAKDGPAALGAVSALREFLKDNDPILCAPGDILIRQGETSETAFLLETGSVLVYAETSYGAVPLATLQAPRLIGEIGVLADLPRTASIKVIEPATVLPAGKAALLDFGAKSPELLFSVIAQLGRQIDSINKAISLYMNALSALEKREFDSGILADLNNPTPELAEFSATFRRFADQIVDKRRQQDEMASAALIQQSLLPNASILEPLSAVLDLHAEMRPARHVGGDFYDFFMLDGDRVAIAAGDVCGKGIPASLFMAIVVTVLRTATREEKDLASAIARANSILSRENASQMFATVFCAVLHTSTGLLEYCNCGHNPPFIVSKGGELSALKASGLPLGLFPGRTPQAHSTILKPEDRLFVFTDGVTEATNASHAEFGEERLTQLLSMARDLSAKDLVGRIFSCVEEHAGGSEQSDDITCLAIRRITTANA
jgi:sigma-B regulation protein RsbU (phosphoserine phosphatase)